MNVWESCGNSLNLLTSFSLKLFIQFPTFLNLDLLNIIITQFCNFVTLTTFSSEIQNTETKVKF